MDKQKCKFYKLAPGPATNWPNYKCDEASNLWQQLELNSELVFHLGDTVRWSRECCVKFNAGKTNSVFHFIGLITMVLFI